MSHKDDLLHLQELDVRIREANQEVKDIPARQSVEQARLDKHREEVKAAEGGLTSSQAAIEQLDLESSSRTEKIEKLRQQQLELKSNREFKAMDAEIHAVRREISGIEDKELVLMERLEEARRELQEKRSALSEEERAVGEDVATLEARATRLKEDMERLQAERQAAAEKIAPEWLARYEKIISRRDRAVVKLTDGVCGGCHMTLPPSVAHDTRKRPAQTSCPYCQRLLY